MRVRSGSPPPTCTGSLEIMQALLEGHTPLLKDAIAPSNHSPDFVSPERQADE